MAADDIGPGVWYQRVKLSVGADGSASDAIPVSNGLDTTAAGVVAVGLVGQLDDVATGAVTENQFAPARISTRRALLVEGVASGTAVPISAASLPSHPVTNAGTFAVQVDAALPAGTNAIGKLAANSGVDIGDVDVTSAVVTGGSVAHDAADAANPIKIGGRADTTFQTSVADGDRVDALFDVYGQLRIRDDHANNWSYHENSSSALTDATVQAAPGAGLSVYITDIVVSTGAATALNVFFEEGATTILGPYYLEAVAGRGLVISFKTPKKATANTAVTITTSAAIAHGIDVTGFIAP